MKLKLHSREKKRPLLFAFLNETRLLIAFAFFMLLQTSFAQVTITPWKMNKGGGIISFSLPNHGDPIAYSKMNIPSISDANWTAAPLNGNGEINFSVRSILSQCLQQLDFTYFETYISIPVNFVINDLKVSFAAADDGARAYIFNSAHPNGAYIGQISLGQNPTSADYSSLAVAGEVNRLVVVQFDDCPTGNNLTGGRVNVNGQVAAINTGGCTQSNFFWSNAPTVSGNTASGTINGVAYTYTSSVNVRTTTNVFNHSIFPTSFNVPNNNPTIQNIEPSTNTLTFASPMTNPVLVFSSIGGGPISVPINFSAPVEVLWSTHTGSGSSFVQNSPTQITGKEAYAIVRMNGTFSSISFDYLTYENYVNFAFGADFSTSTPDTIAPTLTLNGSAIQTINAGSPYTDPGAIVTDNCDTSPTLMVSGSVNANVPDIYTLTYNGVDASGNVSTEVTRTVTVIDPVPTAICQPVTVYLDANGLATVTAQEVDNGSSSFVGLQSLVLSQTNFDCTNLGDNTVTLTVTSTLGSTATCTAVVTVVDNTAPTVITQNITLQLDANGNASFDTSNAYQTIYDNAFSGESTGGGKTTMANWDVLYGSVDVGNFITETQGLSVDLAGNHSSKIRTKSAIGLSPGSYKINLEHKQNGPNRSFNVSLGNVFNQTFVTTSAFKAEEVLFTVTASENAYLTLEQLNAVVGGDDRSGSFVKNIVISKLLPDSAINNNSTDNCGIASMSVSQSDFTCADVGDNTVALTVTDVNGNVSTGTAVVTVEDNIAPTVVTQNMAVQLDASGAASITAAQIDNGSSDNCSVDTMTLDISSFDCSNIGDNTVILTVTDVTGNSSTGTATVTVEDNIAPTVVTQNITVQLDASGAASITATQIDNGSSDNCSVASISIDVTSFDCSNIEDNTVILTVTDVNGNVSTGTATVTVVDSIVPVISNMPADIIVSAVDTSCELPVSWDLPIGADNCSFDLTSTHQSGDSFSVGTTEVVYTITDASGNSATDSFSIIVNPIPMTLNLSSPLIGVGNVTCFGDSDGSIETTVTGGCEPYSYSWSNGDTTANINNLIEGSYTLTITDANNTVITKSITLTEPDLLVTAIDAPAVIDLPTVAFTETHLLFGYPGNETTSVQLNSTSTGGNGNYTYGWSPADGLDNPTSANPTFSPSMDETGCEVFTLTLTVTDAYGCSTTQQVVINAVNVGVTVTTGGGRNQQTSHKVLICHKGKRTISVDYHAVPAHLAHGDSLGSCEDNCGVSYKGSTKSTKAVSSSLAFTSNVLVFPNPSADGTFEIKLNDIDQSTEILLFDFLGKLIERRTIEAKDAVRNIEMDQSKLPSGVYLIKVVNREEVVTKKIIIQRE